MSKTWTPVRWRELTREEEEFYPDITMITDDPLPDVGESVLVTTVWRHYITQEKHYEVEIDTWEGGNWEHNDCFGDVIAWMPLPKHYKEEEP